MGDLSGAKKGQIIRGQLRASITLTAQLLCVLTIYDCVLTIYDLYDYGDSSMFTVIGCFNLNKIVII